MIHTFKSITFFLLLGTLIIGCKTTHQKIQDFVSEYNESARYFSNQILKSTRAKEGSPTEVILNFNMNLSVDKTEQGLYKAIFPDLAAKVLGTLPSAISLLDEGVTFKVLFLTTDKKIIDRLVIDRQKLAELQKDAQLKLSNNEATNTVNPNVAKEIQEMLNLLNANLPFVDKETGVKVLNVAINTSNDLEYTVEVPEDLAALLKLEVMAEAMKKQITEDSDVKNVLTTMAPYGITTLKYHYQNSSGETVNEVTLTAVDFTIP